MWRSPSTSKDGYSLMWRAGHIARSNDLKLIDGLSRDISVVEGELRMVGYGCVDEREAAVYAPHCKTFRCLAVPLSSINMQAIILRIRDNSWFTRSVV